jgi:hypothetical protein
MSFGASETPGFCTSFSIYTKEIGQVVSELQYIHGFINEVPENRKFPKT